MQLSTIIRRVLFAFRRRNYWYAVRNKRTRAWYCGHSERARSHVFDVEFGASQWFDDHDDAYLTVLTIGHPADYQLVRLSIQFNTNLYKMKEITW